MSPRQAGTPSYILIDVTAGPTSRLLIGRPSEGELRLAEGAGRRGESRVGELGSNSLKTFQMEKVKMRGLIGRQVAD